MEAGGRNATVSLVYLCVCAGTRAMVESFSFLLALSFHPILLCPVPIVPINAGIADVCHCTGSFVWLLETDLRQVCTASPLSTELAPQSQQGISLFCSYCCN